MKGEYDPTNENWMVAEEPGWQDFVVEVNDNDKIVCDVGGRTTEIKHGRANLIGAGPDLLNELIRVTDLADGLLFSSAPLVKEINMPTVEAARVAIAKARGES